ncbi:MAG: ABC transporter substrate-binding protein [Lachnospiraceae bacterium]|nr:ABC transporter substrate-binding protein [Lachnospiraceae bacterium]
MKKTIVFLLVLILALSACSAGGSQTTASPVEGSSQKQEGTSSPGSEAPETSPKDTGVSLHLGLLAGPTGMGGAKLLKDSEEGRSANDYRYRIYNAPDEVTAGLISGELDIAAVPTNLAAVLYQKTKGAVQLLALNTLGVLHLLCAEGESISSVEDLKGKTVYSSGQAAVPEYVLNYILDSFGLKDQVTVVYEVEHDAVIAALATGKAKIAVLPEPKVTAALSQVTGLSRVLDLTEEWNKAVEKKGGEKAVLSMGCVVVRKEFADQQPAAVEAFLEDYQASIEYMKNSANLEAAAGLCEEFGIIPKAAVAKKAMAGANLCFVSGGEMKAQIAPFYQILFDYNPASVGGALPDDGFYYGN